MARAGRGQVRIIGGEWRSRRLPVLDGGNIRPSADRARETLFNWLMPVIEGARCLDLFAGTGALAFEAVSRGAASAVMVDNDAETCRQLATNIQTFASDRLSLVQADALYWLDATPPTSFDVVFLDPPFGTDLLAQAVDRLKPGWLHDHSVLYIEHDAALDDLARSILVWQKRKRIGNVHIGLATLLTH